MMSELKVLNSNEVIDWIEILSPILIRLSRDLLGVIGDYLDVIKRLLGSEECIFTSLHICPMCISTDARRIHFTLPYWSLISDTKCLKKCCRCWRNPYDIIGNTVNYFDGKEVSIVLCTDDSLRFNDDATLNLSDVKKTPTVSFLLVCKTCLIDLNLVEGLSYKSGGSKYMIIPTQMAKNRGAYFCPYWLHMIDTRSHTPISDYMTSALIPTPDNKSFCSMIMAIEAEEKLLFAFGKAHLKNTARQKISYCKKCHKPSEFKCMVCGGDFGGNFGGLYYQDGVSVCAGIKCWGLFYKNYHETHTYIDLCQTYQIEQWLCDCTPDLVPPD